MSEAHPLVPAGTVLDGKYVVERTLGEGGMGVVVAARHLVLGTTMAIKVLLPGALVDKSTVERFHREARSAVRIHSPHAARVHDVGTLPNGTPYMVMDLLVGKDLSALLEERGMLSPQETIRFVVQALAALEEAHALGIIHRDLKPANLFLADQPSGPPIVKVLDFGIARDFHEGNEQRLTRTQTLMGSPAYMSPEQMREARCADVRSDIWSIGVCLYELVTGEAPFMADSVADLFVTVLHGTPAAPSALRSDLPPGLSDTILRCLEKDPERRFQSASELATALLTGVSASTQAADTVETSSTRGTGQDVGAALSGTERLATSHRVRAPGMAPRLKIVWLGLVVLGIMGLALLAAARWRRSPSATPRIRSEQGPSVQAPTARGGAPTDLAPSEVNNTAAASNAPAAPSSPPSSTPKLKPSTPSRTRKGVPPAPDRGAAPPPAAAIPPAAPAFDPGKAF